MLPLPFEVRSLGPILAALIRVPASRVPFSTSFRLIHENFGALLAVVRNGFEEFSEVGHNQTRAPVGRRGIAPDALIMIRVFLLPSLDEAFAENIDPALARLEEEVIRMFNDRGRSHDLARFSV